MCEAFLARTTRKIYLIVYRQGMDIKTSFVFKCFSPVHPLAFELLTCTLSLAPLLVVLNKIMLIYKHIPTIFTFNFGCCPWADAMCPSRRCFLINCLSHSVQVNLAATPCSLFICSVKIALFLKVFEQFSSVQTLTVLLCESRLWLFKV